MAKMTRVEEATANFGRARLSLIEKAVNGGPLDAQAIIDGTEQMEREFNVLRRAMIRVTQSARGEYNDINNEGEKCHG